MSVVPLPLLQENRGNIDPINRPGQQLLPGYAVKLLKTAKIPFGTDRTMNGVDIDPTIPLINHILDSFGALRDVNKVYRAKGSLASRSVGARVLFGFTAELGNLLLDAITFNPPYELRDAAILYVSVGNSILSTFPEIAAQVTKSSGKMLIHHAALKASEIMAVDALKMVLKAYPAGAMTADASGALPLHWLTHNSCCNSELLTIMINSNPKAPWIPDHGGYLPLHWAVNQPVPKIDVVAALININPTAASKPCQRGTLPLHWSVNRDDVNVNILKALLQTYPDGARTFDDEGCLPIHRLVSRSFINSEALRLLIDIYPQALQCPNADGQLPLHLAVDQTNPDLTALELLLDHYPGALQVADDEGYLPVHIALDCVIPHIDAAKLLLEKFPQAAYHRTNDGLLPLHCIISSQSPSIDIIRILTTIYPESCEEIAADMVPIDESVDPESWGGEWKKLRWTPLSRSIERRLDPIVILLKSVILANKQNPNSSNNPKSTKNSNYNQLQSPKAFSPKAVSNATSKTLGKQPMPPIHANANNHIIKDDASEMSQSAPDFKININDQDSINNETMNDLLQMIKTPTINDLNNNNSGKHNNNNNQFTSPKAYRSSSKSKKSNDFGSPGSPTQSQNRNTTNNETELDENNNDNNATIRNKTKHKHRHHHHSSSSTRKRTNRTDNSNGDESGTDYDDNDIKPHRTSSNSNRKSKQPPSDQPPKNLMDSANVITNNSPNTNNKQYYIDTRDSNNLTVDDLV